MIWIAIALSALGLLVCIAILFVTTARRRESDANDDAPELADWHTYGGSTPRAATLVVVSLITALVMAFAAGWLVGLISGVVVAAGTWWPRLRPVVIVLAPAALAGAALFILAKQLRYSLEPSFEWPTYFDKVHVLGWVAVAVLVSDLVIREMRARVVARATTQEMSSTELSSSSPQEESRTIDA
jgi:ribose/xylose/arabinose/galactoside ABC-type transport system permease subunit